MTTTLKQRTEDFPTFRQWMEENCQRSTIEDWESDSSIYSAYRFHGFLFMVASDKEDQVEDHISVIKEGEPSQDEDDFDVAYIYNLKAPGTRATKALLIEDDEALKTLESRMKVNDLAKELNANLSDDKHEIKQAKARKI